MNKKEECIAIINETADLLRKKLRNTPWMLVTKANEEKQISEMKLVFEFREECCGIDKYECNFEHLDNEKACTGFMEEIKSRGESLYDYILDNLETQKAYTMSAPAREYLGGLITSLTGYDDPITAGIISKAIEYGVVSFVPSKGYGYYCYVGEKKYLLTSANDESKDIRMLYSSCELERQLYCILRERVEDERYLKSYFRTRGCYIEDDEWLNNSSYRLNRFLSELVYASKAVNFDLSIYRKDTNYVGEPNIIDFFFRSRSSLLVAEVKAKTGEYLRANEAYEQLIGLVTDAISSEKDEEEKEYLSNLLDAIRTVEKYSKDPAEKSSSEPVKVFSLKGIAGKKVF